MESVSQVYDRMTFPAEKGFLVKLSSISAIPTFRIRWSSTTTLSRKLFKSDAFEWQVVKKLENLTASKIFSGAEIRSVSSKLGFNEPGSHTGMVKRLGRVVNYIHL